MTKKNKSKFKLKTESTRVKNEFKIFLKTIIVSQWYLNN